MVLWHEVIAFRVPGEGEGERQEQGQVCQEGEEDKAAQPRVSFNTYS